MLKNATYDGAPAVEDKDATAGSGDAKVSNTEPPSSQSQHPVSPSPAPPNSEPQNPVPPTKLPNATQDVTWRIVEHAVMKAFSVGVGDLNTGSRGAARAAHARQVAMYLAHVTCHHTYTEVGRMANRDRTTVAHACAVVEDGRDDPVFDQTLEHLERSVQLMAYRQTLPTRN